MLLTALSFSACSSDDDEANDPFVETPDEGNGVPDEGVNEDVVVPVALSMCVENQRTVKFIYNEGKLKHILASDGDIDMAVTYNPFKIVNSAGYYGFQGGSGQLNDKGYITSLKTTERTRGGSASSNVSLEIGYTYSMKYDDDGHLIELKLVRKLLNAYSYYGDGYDYLNSEYNLKLKWSDGNLTQITSVGGSYNFEQTTEITYGNQKNVAGLFPVFLGYSLNVQLGGVLPFEYATMLGFMGKGPKNLPNAIYKDSSANLYEYELNEDGTISSESSFNGTTYSYSYTTFQ